MKRGEDGRFKCNGVWNGEGRDYCGWSADNVRAADRQAHCCFVALLLPTWTQRRGRVAAGETLRMEAARGAGAAAAAAAAAAQ